MEINKLKSDHEVFVQKLENNYNDKLIVEYNKFLALEDKKEKMRVSFEQELFDLRAEKLQSEKNLTNEFTEKLLEREMQVEEVS